MRWKPKVGEIYYAVNVRCEVNHYCWVNDAPDAAYYKCGNIFCTRKQAEQAAVKVRKLLLSLQKEKI